MKKRIIALLLGVTLCSLTFAQNSIEEMLSTLATTRVSLDYSFSTTGKTTMKGAGSLTINGDFYKSSGNGLEIFCNGSTRWTVDSFAKEVYIEDAAGTSDFLSDPESFLNKVTSISVAGNEISGTFKDPASLTDSKFKLSNIKESELTEDASEFSFDTGALGSEWVVTDLR